MDSESYLEVRDAATTVARGRTLCGCGGLTTDPLLAWGTRVGAEEQGLIPACWRGLVPNSLPLPAGQGRSLCLASGATGLPPAWRGPSKAPCWALQGGTVHGGG